MAHAAIVTFALIASATVCAANDAATGFKGSILFASGEEVPFEYIGTGDGPMGDLELSGQIGTRVVSYPYASLRSIHVIRTRDGNVQHVEVVGKTGKKVTLSNPSTSYRYPKSSSMSSTLGVPRFVYVDSVTGQSQVHDKSYWQHVAAITIDTQSGRYRWNPSTRRYYPNYYIYDPYDGSELKWMNQPP